MTAAAAAKDKNQYDDPATATVTTKTSESTHNVTSLKICLRLLFSSLTSYYEGA